MATTARPRVTSKGGTNHEEKHPPTRNDEASRMICLPNCAYPLFGHQHLLPISPAVLWVLLAPGKRKKNTRKAVKKSAGEIFNESVGGSCYPRGDLQHVCPSLNELSWGGVRGNHFLKLSQRGVWTFRMCPPGICSFLLLLPIRHARGRWTSTRKRTGDALTVGCVPIASASSLCIISHACLDLALSVHFRTQATMLPNNLLNPGLVECIAIINCHHYYIYLAPRAQEGRDVRNQSSTRRAPPLSTDRRILSPLSTSLNCKTVRAAARKRSQTGAYRQLPGPVQTLDLVNPVPDRLQLLLKPFFLDDLPCSMKNQKRIRANIVVDVDTNNVEAVQF